MVSEGTAERGPAALVCLSGGRQKAQNREVQAPTIPVPVMSLSSGKPAVLQLSLAFCDQTSVRLSDALAGEEPDGLGLTCNPGDPPVEGMPSEWTCCLSTCIVPLMVLE